MEAARSKPVAMKEKAQGARCAEFAGGTTAECAAVCCCCPCALINLFVLAFVRLPCGLCRRAIRRRKRSRTKAAMIAAGSKKPGVLLPQRAVEEDDDAVVIRRLTASPAAVEEKTPEEEEMEKEMWARFYSAGFWRSPSQTEER